MNKLVREFLDGVIGILGVVFIVATLMFNLIPMFLTRDTQNPVWLLIWFVTIPLSMMAIKRISNVTIFKNLK